MITTLLLMIAGFALLYVGAEALIRGGASLALRMGLTPLIVGLTIVAFGTSSPELVVSLSAALAHSGTVAVGNVVGSNICNIALILGLAAVIRPLKVEAQLVRLDVPIAILCSLLLTIFLLNNLLGRWEGLVLTLGIFAYVFFSIRQARRARQSVQQEFAEELPKHGGKLFLDLFFILAGLGALVLGANLFVDGAITLARLFNISEAVIGLTIVAIGTSLPELATSVVAAFKQEGDIAVGNVVGSNIFNILGILGLTALVQPLHIEGISLVDFGLMLALVAFLLPVMRTGFQLTRIEGIILLLVYGGYMIYLFEQSVL